MLFIDRVTLKNVRCFEFVKLKFDLSGEDPPWTVLVGNNGGRENNPSPQYRNWALR